MTDGTPTINTPTQPALSIPVVEPETKVQQLEKLTDAHTEVKETQEDTMIPSEDYRTSPLFYDVASYFGVSEGDYDIAKNELSVIVDYVIKEIGSNDEDKVLLKIRELEDNLYSRPGDGEKRYKNFYRYIRLASRKQSLERAMKAFEKEKTNE
jgi:hypothetical protein